ncbi:24941_t:CDS:2 [Racocetra persica]|uniref:24941_t:CDS:1 n=1 Tax=Racocetra persica TaxID=160502 RepID=A0ACA9L825_9GLOM|nr:24941_t:CDS:2 [Racocetra persica]
MLIEEELVHIKDQETEYNRSKYMQRDLLSEYCVDNKFCFYFILFLLTTYAYGEVKKFIKVYLITNADFSLLNKIDSKLYHKLLFDQENNFNLKIFNDCEFEELLELYMNNELEIVNELKVTNMLEVDNQFEVDNMLEVNDELKIDNNLEIDNKLEVANDFEKLPESENTQSLEIYVKLLFET